MNSYFNTQVKKQVVVPKPDTHPAILMDLSKMIAKFREACCDYSIAEDFNDDCDEIKYIMPFLARVKFDARKQIKFYDINGEKVVSPSMELYPDTVKMFLAQGMEVANAIATAHVLLAASLWNAFLDIAPWTEDGYNPYVFNRKVGEDAYLFIIPPSMKWTDLNGVKAMEVQIDVRDYVDYKIGNLIWEKGATQANMELLKDAIDDINETKIVTF